MVDFLNKVHTQTPVRTASLQQEAAAPVTNSQMLNLSLSTTAFDLLSAAQRNNKTSCFPALLHHWAVNTKPFGAGAKRRYGKRRNLRSQESK